MNTDNTYAAPFKSELKKHLKEQLDNTYDTGAFDLNDYEYIQQQYRSDSYIPIKTGRLNRLSYEHCPDVWDDEPIVIDENVKRK